ncbi:hypothetical protein [Streptomyces sp. NPDC003077]|uniref:hypothetical protein n=1 Tax=Streptomyces sp. NPDC003077 TaxID=3154443 RepID=UPI0033A364A3
MSTFHVNGPVNGPSQWGDGNAQVNAGASASPAEALRLAGELAGRLGPDAPPQAAAVRTELARAEAAGAEPDRGRIREWLDTLTQSVGAAGGTLALIEGIRRALGG